MAFARKFRNVVLTAKIETTKGTDSTPTGAANAVLPTGDVTLTPIDAQVVQRAIQTGYFGAPAMLVGSTFMQVQFAIELQSSGAAGTAPAWGPLLRACAFAEAVTASTRVDYTPVSTGIESVSMYMYADGLLHKLLGAVGNAEFSFPVGGVPTVKFTFVAAYLAPTATANATPTFTSWKDPILVNDANTSDLVLGGTYSAGAISGGTSYVTGGVDFVLGNNVAKLELIGAKDVALTDRSVSGTIKSMDLTAAQEVTLHGYVTAATAQSIGITHGTTAGYKVMAFLPQARLTGLKPASVQGVWTLDVPFVSPPSAGNDDVRIVAL